jgi:hypothetical protein
MKKCIQCGYENPDEVLFCEECGTAFEAAEEPTPEDVCETICAETELPEDAPEETSPVLEDAQEGMQEQMVVQAEHDIMEPLEPQEPMPPSKKSSKNILVIAICAVVAVCILAGATFGAIMLKRHLDDKKAANEVIVLIDSIQEYKINADTNGKIQKVILAYRDLTPKQQQLVTNYDKFEAGMEEFYKQGLIQTGKLVKANYLLCYGLSDQLQRAWHNAIYRKFDKYNNGNYSDFNNSLRAFFADATNAGYLNTIKQTNTTISQYMTLFNAPSAQYKAAYDALRELYGVYSNAYEQAVTANGSYNTYSRDIVSTNNEFTSKYAQLKAVLPEVDLD